MRISVLRGTAANKSSDDATILLSSQSVVLKNIIK